MNEKISVISGVRFAASLAMCDNFLGILYKVMCKHVGTDLHY